MAEARLQEAKTKVDECEARSKESTAAMEAQVQIADEALENANRASEDWAQARMKADLEILRVEVIYIVVFIIPIDINSGFGSADIFLYSSPLL